uniref:Ras association domain family member 5 n=1 Tax=Fundulus heteroclitus TaxID=8078 RepID=A0A3Q2R0W4_FUNHE
MQRREGRARPSVTFRNSKYKRRNSCKAPFTCCFRLSGVLERVRKLRTITLSDSFPNPGALGACLTFAADGSFTGFIKVHLRLSRPVTVEGNRGRAPSDDQDGEKGERTEKRTSFYLPSDCVKQIHIGSLTTTSEVIQGLLKKFMVLDDPRKFALYRQTHRDGQDLFQKLPLSEHPLVLRLIAGPDAEQLTFVLKENETGEVEIKRAAAPSEFTLFSCQDELQRVMKQRDISASLSLEPKQSTSDG